MLILDEIDDKLADVIRELYYHVSFIIHFCIILLFAFYSQSFFALIVLETKRSVWFFLCSSQFPLFQNTKLFPNTKFSSMSNNNFTCYDIGYAIISRYSRTSVN